MATHEQVGRRAYTVAEVAELYGVHRQTVYGWLERGDLVGMKTGVGRGSWRVSVAALDEFEKSHTRSRCFDEEPGLAS